MNLHVASPLNSLLYIFDLITEILISWLRGDKGDDGVAAGEGRGGYSIADSVHNVVVEKERGMKRGYVCRGF